MSLRQLNYPWLLPFALFLLIAGITLSVQNRQPGFGIDYFHFWAVPQLRNDVPVEAIYNSVQHAELNNAFQEEFASDSERLNRLFLQNQKLYPATGWLPTGTPFLYSALGLFQTGNFEPDFWIFQIGSILAGLVGILLMGRVAGWKTHASFWIAVVVSIAFGPWLIDQVVGNTNRLQVGACGFAIWLFWISETGPRRSVLLAGSGGLWAALVLFKPNVLVAPVLIAALLLFRGNFQRFIPFVSGLAAGALVFLVFTAFRFGGFPAWSAWQEGLAEFADQNEIPLPGNCSLTALISQPLRIPVLYGSTILIAGAALWLVWKMRLQSRQQLDSNIPLVASMGLILPLLNSPIAWTHYYLLTIPAITLLFKRLSRPGTVGLGAAVLLLSGIPARYLPVGSPYDVPFMMLAGLAVLLSLSCLALLRPASAEPTATVRPDTPFAESD